MPISLNKPEYILLLLLVPVIWTMMTRSFLKKSSPKPKMIIGGLRSLLVILLAFALSDPQIMTDSDQVNLFFCLDVSKSTGSDTQAAALEIMQKTIPSIKKKDQAGLIIFGKHPSLEISLRNDFDPGVLQSDINTNHTNIHEALQFAIGKLPPKGKNRIVLFTDGNENLQDAMETAYLAASLGIEIYPVPLASWFGKGEVFIKDLETPSTIPLETPFEIRIVVMSSKKNQGELLLFRNDKLLANQPMKLHPGKNVIAFGDILSEPALYRYKAVINFPDDVFPQNNEGLSFTRGTRKSPILYITVNNNASTSFADALTNQGLDIVHKDIKDLTGSIHDLLDYHAIILDNVSGRAISFTTMEDIEKYVKDMGGGLIMIGGDKSFGAGHYKNTPVEKALPVFMDAPTDLRFSGLCLIFVIDKSSSMAASYSGQSKLEMAKIAAFSSIEMLNPTDSVGIVAFDAEFKWIVPITRAGNRQEIAGRLSRLKEEGGTKLFPALKDAFRAFRKVKATKKHVIVLSDGLTDEADFKPLVQSMSKSEISVSTVSIGNNADILLMKSIARWGKGRSYYTDDPKNIPKIFTGETKIITKNLLAEKTMHPTAAMPGEIMKGLDDIKLPAIYGQVVTYPKPGAGVLMKTGQGPLLAAWRYGLGRSVAFASDLSGRWGKDWVLWDHFGKFASQMVKWAQRKETQKKYFAAIDRKGENGTFTLDATTNRNRFINNLDLKVNILLPSKESRTISMEQVAPGKYRCLFSAEEIGEYYFSVFEEENGKYSDPQVFGFGISYTDEFNSIGVNNDLLKRLASTTKGRLIRSKNIPDDLFKVKSGSKEYGISLWPYFTMAFLLLLIADVAARKLLNLSES